MDMKKLISLLLAACMAFSLAACSSGDGGGDSSWKLPESSDSTPSGVEDAPVADIEDPAAGDEKALLPDFYSFSNGVAWELEDLRETSADRSQRVYAYAYEAGDVMVPEYVDLLAGSDDYTLLGRRAGSDSDRSAMYYWFTYNGEADVTEFSCSATIGERFSMEDIDLLLIDVRSMDESDCRLYVMWGLGTEVTESPRHTSYTESAPESPVVDAPEDGDTVTIPSITFFLGSRDFTGGDEEPGMVEMYLSLPKETVPAAYAYAEILCGSYGFEQTGLEVYGVLDYHSWVFAKGGHTVEMQAYDKGADYDPSDERYGFNFIYDPGCVERAEEVYDWPAGEAKPANSSNPSTSSTPGTSGTKELIYDPSKSVSVTTSLDRSSVEIQNPQAYFSGDLAYIETNNVTNYNEWIFKGPAGPMEDFVELLCGGYNLTLVDEYHQTYTSGGQFHAYLLDYTGTGQVRQTRDVPYISGKTGNVAVYGHTDDSKKPVEFRVYIPKDMRVADLGLRHSGGNEDMDLPGTSAGAGLYRLADGSFETTDGRLRAAPEKTMVLRDGETYETDTYLVVKDDVEELWTGGFAGHDLFYFSNPKNGLHVGDDVTMEDIQTGAAWAERSSRSGMLKEADDFDDFIWPWVLGAGHNGKYIIPTKKDNQFRRILVKLLYDSEESRVYYIYAEFVNAPAVYEALCAADKTKSVDGTASANSVPEGKTRCSACQGSGDCTTCGGSGKVRKLVAGTNEWVMVDCTSCAPAGSGKCRFCGGEGYT